VTVQGRELGKLRGKMRTLNYEHELFPFELTLIENKSARERTLKTEHEFSPFE